LIEFLLFLLVIVEVKMMKVFAVLALLVLAVAADYKLKQPDYPCAFQLEVISKKGDEKNTELEFAVNGRYAWYKKEEEDGMAEVLYRPDITDTKAGVKFMICATKMTVGSKETCTAIYVKTDRVVDHTVDVVTALLSDVVGAKFENKDSEKYDGKKCDVYYNDDKEEFAVYVYDEYVYAIHHREDDVDYDLIFDYTWNAPLSLFVFDEKDHKDCVKKYESLADTPSVDYIFCAASNLKVAFVALLVALVSALF